jgi:hypothetical protein
MLKAEPSLAMPNKDMEDPIRINDRTENEDPRVRKSKMDKPDPNAAQPKPYNEQDEPKRAKLRQEIWRPWTLSSTLNARPARTHP